MCFWISQIPQYPKFEFSSSSSIEQFPLPVDSFIIELYLNPSFYKFTYKINNSIWEKDILKTRKMRKILP